MLGIVFPIPQTRVSCADAVGNRQTTVIQLAHAHALIMIYRPFLPLSGLTSTVRIGCSSGGAKSERIKMYQDHCLEAALRVYELASGLVRGRSVSGSFWVRSSHFSDGSICNEILTLCSLQRISRSVRRRSCLFMRCKTPSLLSGRRC